MTRREENYVLDTLEELQDTVNCDFEKLIQKVDENNKMLKQIIAAINYFIANANQENEHDFDRNVLANMLSNMLNINNYK